MKEYLLDLYPYARFIPRRSYSAHNLTDAMPKPGGIYIFGHPGIKNQG